MTPAPVGEQTGATPAALLDLRSEFPIKEQYTFLNHASVSPIPAATQSTIAEFARMAAEEGPSNYPAWVHGMTLARETAARLVGTTPENICFTKSTNHGLMIVANSINWRAGDNVVGLEHEFPANILPWKNLSHLGVEFRAVPERADYTYSIDEIAARIDSRTRLLAVSWVEYATGVRNDIEALAALCKERGILFCVDGIQGLGVLPVDVSRTPIDFIMADGHKWLLAPEGQGILYVNPARYHLMNNSMCGWCGLKNPQDYDNTEQPYKEGARRFEEGSHNLMCIRALGTSIGLLLQAGIENVSAQIETLTSQLMEGAQARGWRVVNPRPWAQRAGIVSLHREDMNIPEMALALQRDHKIMVAARRGFLRVAPHFYNDADEINRLIELL